MNKDNIEKLVDFIVSHLSPTEEMNVRILNYWFERLGIPIELILN